MFNAGMFGQTLEQKLHKALQAVRDPRDGRALVESNIIQSVTLAGDEAIIVLQHADENLRSLVERTVAQVKGLKPRVIVTAEKPAAVPERPAAKKTSSKISLPQIKYLLAVGSGKGGVGKSTVATNLALALQGQNLKVGMLDADIFGPSQPQLLGIAGARTDSIDKKIQPITAYDMPVMSMGMLVDYNVPVVWRGLIVQSAILQMLRDVSWPELDVLVIDLPPGTGDVQLTLAQQVPLSAAVIVSTPQDVALLDAKKSVLMFQKVNVPVLGIIENMSYFCCPNCNHRSDIFAHGGAHEAADKMDVPFLGEIPLDIQLRETSDAGTPMVSHQPDSAHTVAFKAMAAQIWQDLQKVTP